MPEGTASETRVPTVPESLRPAEGGSSEPVAQLTDLFNGPDGFEIRKKKEGYEYRWLNNASHNINKRKFVGGYEIVQGGDPEEAGVKAADGTRVNGDLVLGRRPVDVGNEKRNRIRAIQQLIEGQPADRFHQMAEQINRESRDGGMTGPGVTTFETDDAGNELKTGTKPHRKNFRMGATFDSQGNIVR